MNPLWFFPVLVALFAALATGARLRQGTWRGAARTWCWLALCFAAVSLWLQVH